MTRNDLSHPYGAGCILTCVLVEIARGLSYKRSHIEFAHENGMFTLSSHGAVIGDFPVGFERGQVQDRLIHLAEEHRAAVAELVLSTTAAWRIPAGYQVKRSTYPYPEGGKLTYLDFILEADMSSFDQNQFHGFIRVFLDVPEVRYWYCTGHRYALNAQELVRGPSSEERAPLRTYPAGLALAEERMIEAFRLFSDLCSTENAQLLPTGPQLPAELPQERLGNTNY